MNAPGRWTRVAEVGTTRGLRVGAWIHRRFGRRPSQLGLVLAAAYYAARNGAARRGSQRYLARLAATPEGHRALPRRPGPLLVVRHFYEFAVNLYDRMLAWGGAVDTLDLRHDGTERVFDLARSNRGALLLGAHLGSLELLGFLARRYQLKFNVVAFYQNAERINAFLESLGTSQVRLIELDPGFVGAAFDIRACLERGEFVVILADRVPPGAGARTAEASFLGQAARFPLSPFLLAGVLGCPIFLALCVRTGTAQYTSIMRPIAPAVPPRRGERDKRARELLARYAALLEEMCQRHPLQWFNFFDFWEEEPA
jgi:predicted LPLAT superfamily acyltransferase